MTVKKYTGETLEDAINIAKVNLGENIEIIDTKYIKRPGVRGLFSKKYIEITVIQKENFKKNSLEKEIENLKNIISSMENPKKSNDVEKICNKLKSLNVNAHIIEDIKKSIINKTDKDMSSNLVDYLRENINITKNRYENENMVLVGPPGVGKTTTIAKIAANLVFKENKKVGVITIDTYRIGAVEQLKIYTEIMNIKFEAVLSADEMESAIETMNDCDIILIDTTGRGCKNSLQISELNSFIKKANTTNINLVLSVTTKEKDIEAIIDSYSSVNFENVILTKVDETTTYGTILNIIDYAKKPIAYITTGQNVPDDILKPSKDELIRILLGVESI